jgi:hypothetical protein
MSDYNKENELVAYCGIYCRLCDYFTGRIRASARDLLEVANKHNELKIFADTSKAFNYENFMKGLEWLSREMSPCIGGCKGGGGWEDCPIRKCCKNKGLRFCYECDNYPCETLKRYPKRIEQLNDIKKTGLETWINKELQ